MVSETAGHLCVLVHGLWGNPSHLRYLETSIQEAYPELHVLVAKSNADSFTYDGIDVGGERTANEIEQRLKELEEEGHNIKKISIVGYSLGGLVARYAIGLLYTNKIFDKIQPVNFTTFATPHLGVRTPMNGAPSYMWNVLGARTLSTSGRQLFTVDKFRDTGRPLLAIMAEPQSIFLRALRLFKNRSLYCNIINDRSVVYYTSAISRKDPFVDLGAVHLNPLPGYEGVLLRPDEPVRPRTRKPMGVLERIRSTSRNAITTIPFALLLVILVPVGSTLFLVNSGYQTFRSARRVKLYESGQGGFRVERYRIPLIEEARNMGDRVYERLNTSNREDYLPTPPPELELEQSSNKSETSSTNSTLKLKGQDKFPTLALTEDQFAMIDGLNDVGFVKYPVHIKKVRHSHAAIVVRMQSEWRNFSEGKIVVAHWIENFEV